MANGAELRAEFSDGHAADIRARDILTGDILADDAVPGLPAPVLWEGEDAPPPVFDFAEVAESEEGRRKVADSFVRFGYALTREVPRQEGRLRGLRICSGRCGRPGSSGRFLMCG